MTGRGAPTSTRPLGLIAEQARQDAQREIQPGDADRLFYQRPVPQRIVIMLGGPVMNLLVAVVLLAIVVCGFGVPHLRSAVQSVSNCVPDPQSRRTPAVRPAPRRHPPRSPA